MRQFEDDLGGSGQRHSMSDRDEQMFILVLVHQYDLTPLSTRFSEKTYRLPLHPQLIPQVLLYLTLMQSIHIEETLSASYGGQVHQDPQVARIAALVLMEDSIAINQDELWPEMRFVGLQPLEELQGGRQFSEG